MQVNFVVPVWPNRGGRTFSQFTRGCWLISEGWTDECFPLSLPQGVSFIVPVGGCILCCPPELIKRNYLIVRGNKCYIFISASRQVHVHSRLTSSRHLAMNGDETTRTQGIIPGGIYPLIMRKFKCFCLTVFWGSSWFPRKDRGISILWVSCETFVKFHLA